MLKMVDIEFIRKKHFLDGWSIRKISRQLGIARQTVRKALASSDRPRYHRSKPRPCPVMDPYRGIIEAWLAADEHAPPKQRHTAKRIYDRLVAEHGFGGHEATVRRCVAQLRDAQPEVYIPLTAGWGQQAQVDWGQAVVEIAGKREVAHLFCLKMRASDVPFAWASPTEKLEAFLEGHVRAFAWLEGYMCNGQGERVGGPLRQARSWLTGGDGRLRPTKGACPLEPPLRLRRDTGRMSWGEVGAGWPVSRPHRSKAVPHCAAPSTASA